jgi:hypothetical protein
MRTPLIEIGDVLGHYPTKVALTEDKGVIQTFLPDRSYPSLGDRICLWRSEWGANLRDSKASYQPVEEGTVAAIAITSQEAWGLAIPAAAFHDLLRDPFRRGMLCDLGVQHFATGMADHEEHIESLEPQSLDAKEVTGPNLRSMAFEKASPAGRRSAIVRQAHVLGNGSA